MKQTSEYVESIISLVTLAIFKLAFLVAACWMIYHDYTYFAIACLVVSALPGGYNSDKEPKGEDKK